MSKHIVKKIGDQLADHARVKAALLDEYDLDADTMATQIREWAEAGFLNIVGGCCGTTPEHIAADLVVPSTLTVPSLSNFSSRASSST